MSTEEIFLFFVLAMLQLEQSKQIRMRRKQNEFDVCYGADLNISKDLDPNYWISHYCMSPEAFDSVVILYIDLF